MEKICLWRTCKNKLKEDEYSKVRKFCSRKCKNKTNVDKRRIVIKTMCLEHKGNKCLLCGYKKCRRALEFHHIKPEDKKFGLAQNHTIGWEKAIKEVDKCVLVCSNCHAEIEDGLITKEEVIEKERKRKDAPPAG